LSAQQPALRELALCSEEARLVGACGERAPLAPHLRGLLAASEKEVAPVR
jgi:hypothetical protein